MNNINYSHESSTDLAMIEKYITDELTSPKAAKSTIAKIIRKIGLLREHAELGAKLSSIADVDVDYRFLVSGKYIVFYRIDGNDIYIIRVIYARRDYISLLFGEEQDS
ncbi:MAG: type II toxin-antitoxin system RelE/ParE family toxin [Oscillospiraceae bacterium]|nr:type II toxin-antitoxin system RelE/ParE family toxin [Oscillospiraceae bacterium]